MPITGPIRRSLQGPVTVQPRSSGVNVRTICRGARTLPPLSLADRCPGFVSVTAFHAYYSTRAARLQPRISPFALRVLSARELPVNNKYDKKLKKNENPY